MKGSQAQWLEYRRPSNLPRVPGSIPGASMFLRIELGLCVASIAIQKFTYVLQIKMLSLYS